MLSEPELVIAASSCLLFCSAKKSNQWRRVEATVSKFKSYAEKINNFVLSPDGSTRCGGQVLGVPDVSSFMPKRTSERHKMPPILGAFCIP